MSELELETHPFEPFVPINANALLIGSFPGKESTQAKSIGENDWFYGAKRSQFWKIISAVYGGVDLSDKKSKQNLFEEKGIGITDIILKARRKNNSNLDDNLIDIVFNTESIGEILSNDKITTVFFTSKFVENHFRKLFPKIEYFVYLPSPSPRYARMKKEEKINIYKSKLPK